MSKPKLILPKPTNDSKPRIVSRELNLDFGQFFYPAENRKIFAIRRFESFIKDGEGNEQRIVAIVKADQTLGTLTTFDERVFYCLVEFWEEQGRPIKVSFSEREIARRLKIGWGQCTARAIDDSLNRLRTVPIQWLGSFYNARLQQYTDIKNPFTILSHLQVESTKNRAFKAQIAEFSFDERTITNLTAKHSRPIRVGVILDFRSPLAQSVYTLLERKMYKTANYHRATQSLFYEDFGILAKRYQHKSIRHQELRGIRDQILNQPTSYGEIYNRFEIDPDRDVLIVGRTDQGKRRGRKVGESIDVLPLRVEIELASREMPVEPRNEAEIGEDSQKALSSLGDALAFVKSDVESPTLLANTQNEHNPSKKPANVILKLPIPTPSADPAYRELLAYFDTVFERGARDYGKSEISKANACLSKYGLNKAKFLVNFAKQEARKTNFYPATFSAIIQYERAALEAWDKHQKETEQQRLHAINEEQTAIKRRLEIAAAEHRHKYQEDYLSFIDDLVDSLIANHPKEIEAFRQEHQRKQKAEVEKIAPHLTGLRATALRLANNEMRVAFDMSTFFKAHPTINVPTFEEWDRAYNPHGFSHWHLLTD